MNINYHYFAVKVLAVRAGFKEEDAQRIAFYSQAVDDYDLCAPMLLEDVPPYARHLAKEVSGKWMFLPVTTGFSNWFDYARLALESNQRSITIPFHFIPPQKLTAPVSTRKEYCVIPAKIAVPSLIQDMLLEARDAYLKAPVSANLIRIGMLLHTFADTYAHQNFSGFWGWENNACLTVASDSINQDIGRDFEPPKHVKVPPIGHAALNLIPDNPDATYSWKQKRNSKDNYSMAYARSNAEEFCNVSLEILNYLLTCNRQPPLTKDIWNEYANKFKKGLLTAEKEIAKLPRHWQMYFPDMQFCYEKTALFRPTDDFFRYNVFADEIRRKVNGIANKEIDFRNYITQVSDDDAQFSRLVSFQANN